MNRNFALLAAASMVVGGMSILGCEQDRDDVRTTRIYETNTTGSPRDVQVRETRRGTVVVTDEEDVTAVRTPAPRGANAAERMGISSEDAMTGGRTGADLDEPAGESGVGGAGLGTGSVDPLVGQTGSGSAGETRSSGSAEMRTSGERVEGSVGVGTDRVDNTRGGVVAPVVDDDDDIIINRTGDAVQAGDRQPSQRGTADGVGGAIDQRSGDGRQPDPDNPQRQQTADPGAAGSITESADPGRQTTPRQADPGAPGSVTSTPRSGNGDRTDTDAGPNTGRTSTGGSNTGSGANTGDGGTGRGGAGSGGTGGAAGGSSTGTGGSGSGSGGGQ